MRKGLARICSIGATGMVGLVSAHAGEAGAINDVCPVTEAKIDRADPGATTTLSGLTIALSSAEAKATWDEWPGQKQAEAAATMLAARVVNERCPFSGEAVNPEIRSTFDATTVAFCCDAHCKPAWEKLSEEDKRAKLLTLVSSDPLNTSCPKMPEYDAKPEIALAYGGVRIIFGGEGCRDGFNAWEPQQKREYVVAQLAQRHEDGRPLVLKASAQSSASDFTRNVAIVIFPGVEVLDFTGPGEVFQAAGSFGRRNDERAFNTYTVALSTEPLVSQGFLTVVPEYSYTECPTPDILVIPGGPIRSLMNDDGFLAWVKELAQGDTMMMSVCTGAFVYGKAGLLDGLEVTTWYGAIPGLRDAHPEANVLEGRRFIDNGNVVTTAGVSAGIDGSLHVVARLLGLEVAAKTARYMEYRWMPEAAHLSDYQMSIGAVDETPSAP